MKAELKHNPPILPATDGDKRAAGYARSGEIKHGGHKDAERTVANTSARTKELVAKGERVTRLLSLLSGIIVILASCNRKADQAGFYPKADRTEVFHLRSQCAVLGRNLAAENVVDPGLVQHESTHYDPASNRCFVHVNIRSADPVMTVLAAPSVNRDYLYDGQTRELIAMTYEVGDKKNGEVNVEYPLPNFHGKFPSPHDLARGIIIELMKDDWSK